MIIAIFTCGENDHKINRRKRWHWLCVRNRLCGSPKWKKNSVEAPTCIEMIASCIYVVTLIKSNGTRAYVPWGSFTGNWWRSMWKTINDHKSMSMRNLFSKHTHKNIQKTEIGTNQWPCIDTFSMALLKTKSFYSIFKIVCSFRETIPGLMNIFLKLDIEWVQTVYSTGWDVNQIKLSFVQNKR